MESFSLIFAGILLLGGFIIFLIVFRFFNFWLRARLANAPIGLFKMFGMSLRKAEPSMVVSKRLWPTWGRPASRTRYRCVASADFSVAHL